MKRWKEMSIEELREERADLVNEYYYWMDRSDCTDDILEEIELEIYAVERFMNMKEAK